PNSASPPTTCPSIIMITAASRAAGTAASSSSASAVTAITALADLADVRSVCQPVITLTSLARSASRARATHQQHDMSCPRFVNAPVDQDLPATVRRADRRRSSTTPCARSVRNRDGTAIAGAYYTDRSRHAQGFVVTRGG